MISILNNKSRLKSQPFKSLFYVCHAALFYQPYSSFPEPFIEFRKKEDITQHIKKQPAILVKTFDDHVKDFQYLESSKDIAQSSRKILKTEYKKLYNLEKKQIDLSKKISIKATDCNTSDHTYRARQFMIKNALCTVYSFFLRKNVHLEVSNDRRATSERFYAYNCLGIEGRAKLEDEYLEARERLMKMFLIPSLPNDKKFKTVLISTKFARREYFTIRTLPKILEKHKTEFCKAKNKEDIKAFTRKVEDDLQQLYNNMTLKETLENYKAAFIILHKYAKRNKGMFLDSNYRQVVETYNVVIPELEDLFHMYLKAIHRNWNKIKSNSQDAVVHNSLKSRLKHPIFCGHNLSEKSKAQRTLTGLIKFAKQNILIKKFDDSDTNLKKFEPKSLSSKNSLMNKTKKYLSKKVEKDFFDSLF